MQVLSVKEMDIVSGGLSKEMQGFVGTVFGAAAGTDLALAGAELGAWGGPLGAAIGAGLGYGLAWGLSHPDPWKVIMTVRNRR